jgi:transposase-like protein
MVRNSLAFVPWKDRKEVAADLKTIYSADTEELALENLDEFAQK